ncbi:hypothetical protein AAY473_040514 [Plecturocebus cupreus]
MKSSLSIIFVTDYAVGIALKSNCHIQDQLDGVLLCPPGWSEVAPSRIIAISASRVQVLLLLQPPKYLELQLPIVKDWTGSRCGQLQLLLKSVSTPTEPASCWAQELPESSSERRRGLRTS